MFVSFDGRMLKIRQEVLRVGKVQVAILGLISGFQNSGGHLQGAFYKNKKSLFENLVIST